jgi:murein DD-endopeptidase MepM/ murein hydrolase activator NlpD
MQTVRARLAIGLVALLALVGVGMAERADRPDPPEPRAAAAPTAVAEDDEPVLGAPGSTPPAARSEPAGEESDEEVTSATGGASGAESEGEKLPDDILAENARIRRDLEVLAKLERERQEVRRALVRAGADFSGPLRLGASGLAWPVNGTVTSPFGPRWGRLHAGIDIASPAGTAIRAAADGKVVLAGPTGGYGNYVCVQHTTRLNTCYAHLSRYLTENGATVAQGQPIGLVGCTGSCFGDHLHFETWVDGQPTDPLGYLR